MSDWHLISCDCGKTIRVQPRNAGESRTCECGTEIVLPTMREIRRLPLDEAKAAESKSEKVTKTGKNSGKAHWHPALAAMFVTGIPVLLIGLFFAGYALLRAREIPKQAMESPGIERVIAAAPGKLGDLLRMDFDNASINETVSDFWNPLLKNQETLPEQIEPPHIFYRGIRDRYVGYAKWASIAVAAGLALTLIPLLSPKRK